MRFIFLFLFVCLSMNPWAQDIKSATRSLAESPEIKNGRFSFYAKEIGTGRVIIEHDIDKKVSPASTLKLLTTYAVMDILGPDHRFRTRVGIIGDVDESGRLNGDVIIEAGGDPALGSETFADDYGNGEPISQQVAAAIRGAGIKSIGGKLIFDESIYEGIDIPDEWTWQDMGNYYAAAPHAFTYEENMMKVYFKTGRIVGQNSEIQKMDPKMLDLKIENQVKAADIRSDQAFFYSSPYSGQMRMFGRIPLNKRSFEVKGAVPNPAAVFRADLIESLGYMDISIEGNEIAHVENPEFGIDVEEILALYSPSLEVLVAHTNLRSVNLYAEHFIRQVGQKRKGKGSFTEGIKAIEEWCAIKGISTKTLRLTDGSGLSRADHVSTRFMVELLTSLYKETYYEAIKRGLPVAGRSGSMRRIGKNSALEGNLFAKTGYIEGARGYCGFLELGDEVIAVSILANDYDLSASQMREKMNELLKKLVE